MRRYEHGYPFFPRAQLHVVALPVTAPAVAVWLRDGVDASLLAVEPPYPVFPHGLQPGRHLRSQKIRYLLETVRSVDVVSYQPPQNSIIPQRSTLRSRYPFGIQARLYSPYGDTVRCQPEDLVHHPHLRLVDKQTVAGFVEAEAVRGRRPADHMSLTGSPQLPPSTSFGYLDPLVLGELVEDAVRELTLRGIVSPIVQGADLGAVFLELPLEKVVIGWFAGKAVPVLDQHHRDAPRCHQDPHAVHAWPLQARPALAGVGDLLEDLVAFSGGVLAQGF